MGALYRWNFAPVLDNLDVLWAGAIGTLRLFVICLVLGFGFGLVVGLGRHARSRWVYLPATAFVEFFRNTPVLVQILWFYYALPILLPFQISPLTAAQAMRRIVLPQALRRMLPALTNRGIEIFKMTTLASAVAYVELLQQGKLLASLNFNPIETYTVIAVVFFLCLFPLVQATYALERRLGRSDA